MEFDLIKEVGGFGVFAILFVAQWIYTTKENKKREGKYQEIILKNNETLTENQNIIQNITDVLVQDTKEIKNDTKEIKSNVEIIKFARSGLK